MPVLTKQKANTVFNAKHGRSTPYGYQPQKLPNYLPPKNVIAANTESDSNTFFDIFGEVMPGWWPCHPDGHPWTNLGRLIDDDDGLHMVFPVVSEATSRKLRMDVSLFYSSPVFGKKRQRVRGDAGDTTGIETRR